MSLAIEKRLERLEVPRSGTAVVCLAELESGETRVLWRVPCRNPSHVLTIRLPPGAADPVFSIEEFSD